MSYNYFKIENELYNELLQKSILQTNLEIDFAFLVNNIPNTPENVNFLATRYLEETYILPISEYTIYGLLVKPNKRSKSFISLFNKT